MNDSSGINKYMDTYKTFSGCDMTIVINVPLMVNGNKIVKNYVVGEIQTLTYSTSMNRQPIRSISNVNAKDYVMGQRSIAGTMVFSVFDRHFASRIIDDLNELYGTGVNILVDELPPFNINIVMANEYGHNSNIVIYGVRFINEGQVMSINDIYMENTYQYVATGMKYADNTKHPNQLINQNKIVEPKNDSQTSINVINSKNISDINRERPGNYDDIKNKYQIVTLTAKQHKWVGKKKEVSLSVNPNRRTGFIIIRDMNDREIARLNYKGDTILYALRPGGYYARYTDTNSSSNVEYIQISRPISNNQNNETPGISRPDKGDSDRDKDNPIIDDIEDDNITVTDNNVVIKDMKDNEFYPNREGHVYGLLPNTKYVLYHDGGRIEFTTETDKYVIYNKLKESIKNKFYDKEMELSNILYDFEYEIYNKEKNIIEAAHFINNKYLDQGSIVHGKIIDNILLNLMILIQNKKTSINNNSNTIPKIESYYSNRILLSNDIIKLIINKYPYDQNAPIEIYPEGFVNKDGKKYYDINDPNYNLYRVSALNKNGIKTPSIYLFSGVGSNDTTSLNQDYSVDKLEKIEYSKSSVYIDKNKHMPPTIIDIDKNRINLHHDTIKDDEFIVCSIADDVPSRGRHIKKIHNNGFVTIDRYEIAINKDNIFLAWVENKEGEVVSDVLPFVLDSETNKKITEIRKDRAYTNIMRNTNYKDLNVFSKQLVLRTIEESNMTWTDIKSSYIKDFVLNSSKIGLSPKNIIFFDLLRFSNMFGYRKKDYLDKINKDRDRVFLDENEIADIDVICKTTGDITTIHRKNIINLSYFKNSILIIKIKDGDLIYKPFLILPFNEYEVI